MASFGVTTDSTHRQPEVQQRAVPNYYITSSRSRFSNGAIWSNNLVWFNGKRKRQVILSKRSTLEY